MPQESLTLYYRAGNSDKVYQTAIEAKDGGFVVTFAFGRRGSTLQTGAKTTVPVSFEKAQSIFDHLIKEKMAKGYTPGASGTPYQQTNNEHRATGLRPQLLNPIDADQAEKLINDSGWWMQEKFDGKRVLLRKDAAGEITGINRRGLVIGLPEPIIQHAKQLTGTFIIDGECIGDKLYAFDCLKLDGIEVSGFPYNKRLEILMGFIKRGAIECAPTAVGPGDKRDLFRFLKQEHKEGCVFKRNDAPYTPGRPANGGTQLKHKFYATGSFIVAKVNTGKRSVALEVIGDAGQRIGVGNVTIPVNQKVPGAGTIIEVRYLYYFSGGSLFQPVFLGVRDDLEPGACGTSQLKLKSEEDES